MRFRILLPIVTVCLLPLSACGGGGSGSGTPSGSSNRAPVISGGNQTVSVAENSSGTLFTATATDADGDTITFSLSGGDAGLFTVTSSGAVSFLSSPNYDLPTDDNSDNVYSFNVVVSDGKASSSIAAQVTVTNDREGISVKRLSQSVSAGAVVGLNNQSGKLFVVGQDGNMSLLDPDGGSQAVPGNAFFSGETGRVMAAVSDRSWMFVMLSIDGQGEVVRFFHATNSSYANPTATLAAEVDADVRVVLPMLPATYTRHLAIPRGILRKMLPAVSASSTESTSTPIAAPRFIRSVSVRPGLGTASINPLALASSAARHFCSIAEAMRRTRSPISIKIPTHLISAGRITKVLRR